MSDIDFKRLSREMAGSEGLAGSTIMVTIITLFGIILLWASWAELDNVTRGEGRIVSSVQNQIVQAAEGGVILRRFVAENSVVSEGDVMFEIDPVDASSELNRLAQRLSALDIKALRLRAEIEAGGLLGEVIEPATREVLERIASPIAGRLLAVREHPPVFPGSMVARVISR